MSSSLPPSSREETRKKSYKTVLYADDARRRREYNLVDMRKNFRQDNLLKKRTDQALLTLFPQSPTFNQPNNKNVDAFERNQVMVDKIWSSDPVAQLEAATHFAKLLEIDKCPFIDAIIKAGVVPRFVEFLTRYEAPVLQLVAAAALCNIAAERSQYAALVINLGAIPLLVQLLLRCRCEKVRSKAMSVLANVAGDSPHCRDIVLNHGALLPLLAQLSQFSMISTLRIAAWAILNLCRGNPPPHFHQVKPVLPKLRELIQLNDDDVLRFACSAIFHLSDGRFENIQVVLDAGVFPRLVQLLQHPNSVVIKLVLRIVGRLLAGDDAQTQFMLNNGVLPGLHQVITNSTDEEITRSASWAISNITSGTIDQIQAVINANVIPPLVTLLQNADFLTKREVAWAILNVAKAGTLDQIRYVVNEGGCMKPLCDALRGSDAMGVSVCLHALDKILMVGEDDKQKGLNGGINIYAQMVDKCEGLDNIRKLQACPYTSIALRAITMFNKYWPQHTNTVTNTNKNNHPLYNTLQQQQHQDFTFGVLMPPPTPLPNFPFR